MVASPALLFGHRTASAVQSLLCFYTNSKIVFPSIVKNVIKTLSCTELVDHFW